MFYKNISGEVRHLWVALSTYRMNVFDQVRSNHSTWPMTLCIYNLLPYLCMKRSYIQMAVLIQWPKQLGNDIDMFLEPMIDELVQLFNKGVEHVWDEYKKEHDQGSAYRYNHRSARATLPVKREDKRLYGCVECLDDTNVVHLKNNSKLIYMGHHKFLPTDQPYHRNKKRFWWHCWQTQDSKLWRSRTRRRNHLHICNLGGVEFVCAPHNILFSDHTYPFLMIHLLTIYYNIAPYRGYQWGGTPVDIPKRSKGPTCSDRGKKPGIQPSKASSRTGLDVSPTMC